MRIHNHHHRICAFLSFLLSGALGLSQHTGASLAAAAATAVTIRIRETGLTVPAKFRL